MHRDVARAAVALALTAALCIPAPTGVADEGGSAAAPPTVAEVRAAFDRAETARKSADAMLFGDVNVDLAKHEAAARAASDAKRDFVQVFSRARWDELDPKRDEKLLTDGLLGALGIAGDARARVRVYEAITRKLPSSPESPRIAAWELPKARLECGDVEPALADWERAAEAKDLRIRGRSILAIGQVQCARGDVAAAKAAWKRLTSIPGQPPDLVPQVEDAFLSLLGKPAPAIRSKSWIGVDPRELTAFRGRILVLHYFETWHPGHRTTLQDAQRASRTLEPLGVSVVGVTRVEDTGFLPGVGAKDVVNEGRRVGPITEGEFQAHLRTFRERSAISFPFVTATPEELAAYRVKGDGWESSGNTTVAVIDRNGKVAFVGEEELGPALWQIAVRRLLDAKK